MGPWVFRLGATCILGMTSPSPKAARTLPSIRPSTRPCCITCETNPARRIDWETRVGEDWVDCMPKGEIPEKKHKISQQVTSEISEVNATCKVKVWCPHAVYSRYVHKFTCAKGQNRRRERSQKFQRLLGGWPSSELKCQGQESTLRGKKFTYLLC